MSAVLGWIEELLGHVAGLLIVWIVLHHLGYRIVKEDRCGEGPER